LRGWADRDLRARIIIRGKVQDIQTNRPVQGARVSTDIHDFTDDGFVLTDAQGQFTLSVPPGSNEYLGSIELRTHLKHVPLWVEADGRASALQFVTFDAATRNEEQVVLLKPETPFFGAVVDTSGRPVVGAVVKVYPTRRASITGGPILDDLVDLPGTFAVQTDSQGRFSFRGLPAPDPKHQTHLDVTHPEFQANSSMDDENAVDPATTPLITLEPGCTVAGVVVNRRGDPVSGASVRVKSLHLGDEDTTSLTDSEGRFQLRNVEPGRKIVLVQSPRLAAAWTLVVADPRRPVQNQFVLQPGETIGGKVLDPDGKPVAGASVGCSLLASDDVAADGELELELSTPTAEDGSFRLGPLPPGGLLLRADLDSHKANGELTVTDITKQAVITLKKPEPPRRK
jgi:uncharacterized GH25 family protein